MEEIKKQPLTNEPRCERNIYKHEFPALYACIESPETLFNYAIIKDHKEAEFILILRLYGLTQVKRSTASDSNWFIRNAKGNSYAKRLFNNQRENEIVFHEWTFKEVFLDKL